MNNSNRGFLSCEAA